jgi:hypothetical protein
MHTRFDLVVFDNLRHQFLITDIAVIKRDRIADRFAMSVSQRDSSAVAPTATPAVRRSRRVRNVLSPRDVLSLPCAPTV